MKEARSTALSRRLTPHDPASRRVEERTQVYLPAQVDSENTISLGIMQDLSRSGGRLYMNRRLEVGTDIRIILSEGVERNGIVRRCADIAGSKKFDIGFELTEACWPEHLVGFDAE